jgi:cell division protein FtsB
MSTQWDYLLADRKPVRRAEPEPRPRRRWLLALIALLLLLVGVGTYGSVRGRGDVARVQQLRQELFAAKTATPDQRKATAEQFRQEMRKLSPGQRSELFVAGQKEAVARLDAYFAMSPAEKRQHLDRAIDRMEQWRKERANRPPGAGGPPGSGRRPGGDRPRSAEEVEKHRKERLDRTTPEQRAMMDQLRAKGERFRNDLNQRRAQRGLPAANGPGGFGPR